MVCAKNYGKGEGTEEREGGRRVRGGGQVEFWKSAGRLNLKTLGRSDQWTILCRRRCL